MLLWCACAVKEQQTEANRWSLAWLNAWRNIVRVHASHDSIISHLGLDVWCPWIPMDYHLFNGHIFLNININI